MEIKQLQFFVETARFGSFAGTARSHNVEPSTVSRAVAALEDDLGIRLFQRSTRRMSLTEAGRHYLDRIEPMLEELRRATQSARALNDRPYGTLRLTSSVAFGQRCLTPLLPAFRRAFPELDLELILSDDNLDLVAERIDLAIRLAPRPVGGEVASKLFSTQYRVVASPEYLARASPINRPSDLAEHQCLLFTLQRFRRRWLFQDTEREVETVPVRGNIVISNALALHSCALNGLGPALLAGWLVDAEISAGKLIDVFPSYRVTATEFETAAWMIFPNRAYLPLKVRVASDFLRQNLAPEHR